ncbi:MAG TPA: Type 1 glutamine amidotransferase-like domain-containing protein [Candidatus Limnocylindrales bacterium]
MNGLMALVGSGEFTSAMDEVDRGLLAEIGRANPRVAIVPTASWPDGEAVFMRWAAMGEAHFEALGATTASVLIRDRAGADEPAAVADIERADLIYFSGGKPGHLLAALRDSAAGVALRAAHARGAVIAGCSAGAMVLGAHQVRIGGRRFLQMPVGWEDALGLVPGVVVMPHYDALPETLIAPLALAVPDDSVLVGIDENTALIGRDGAWIVGGSGRVTIWRGSRRERFRADSAVSI